jgi:DNA-binding GntR family transcriptional regulator
MSIIKQVQPLYQQVYEEVKKLILTGKVAPGSRIRVSKLAQEYKISRTPLREALRQLQNEGLLVQDHKGTTVITLEERDFENLCSCRLMLEKEIIKLSIRVISDERLKEAEEYINKSELSIIEMEDVNGFLEWNSKFHEVIINSIENIRLIQLLNQTRSLLLLYRAKIVHDRTHKLEIVKEHRNILEALKGRDEKKAVCGIEKHLENDRKRGQAFFKVRDSYF